MGGTVSDFLRRGGHGVLTFRALPAALSRKDAGLGLDAARARFESSLGRADQANAEIIIERVGPAFTPPLTPADLADLSPDRAEVMAAWDARAAVIAAEWGGQPDRLAAARLAMEDDLLRAFAAHANERRQAHLGITRYVWRSRDDERVRHAHAALDDRVFDWEEPPEGGHPGMAWGCRCWAEPLVEPAEPYVPLSDVALVKLASDAELDGQELATRDALLGVFDSLLALPGAIDDTSRFLALVRREEEGALSPAEARELRSMRQRAVDRVDAVLGVIRDPASFVLDPWAYQARLGRAADDMTVAYLEGQATEGMVAAVHRDSGYAQRSALLGAAAALTAFRLPSARTSGRDLFDAEALRRFWRDESGAVVLPRLGSGWAVRPNEGIWWGGPLRLQGVPWEDMLSGDPALGVRLSGTFPVVDFFNSASGLVTSAKTLSTRSLTYVDEPSRIFGRLRRYVDRLAAFDGDQRGRFDVPADQVRVRRLALAVPSSTTSDQMFHIQRAVDYARAAGVDLVVTRID